MSFRAKLKKTFGGKRSGENTLSGDSTPRRSDIEYYKPHEIPKSKYRGHFDPEHQEKLHSFSFADAFGRRASSIMSGAFSPGGTKAQSRRGSWMSRTKSTASEMDSKSLRRKSMVPDTMKKSDQGDTEVANSRCLMRLEERANIRIAALSRKAVIQDTNTAGNGDNPVSLTILPSC